MLPLSLPTMTAEAVAVGQIKASIAPSHNILAPRSASNCNASQEQNVKSKACISNTQRCQRRGRISRGRTLQKLRNSIENSNAGCR